MTITIDIEKCLDECKETKINLDNLDIESFRSVLVCFFKERIRNHSLKVFNEGSNVMFPIGDVESLNSYVYWFIHDDVVPDSFFCKHSLNCPTYKFSNEMASRVVKCISYFLKENENKQYDLIYVVHNGDNIGIVLVEI